MVIDHPLCASSTAIHGILLFSLCAWQSFCTTSVQVFFGLHPSDHSRLCLLKCQYLYIHTHTHNHFMAFLDFVRDYSGDLAPER